MMITAVPFDPESPRLERDADPVEISNITQHEHTTVPKVNQDRKKKMHTNNNSKSRKWCNWGVAIASMVVVVAVAVVFGTTMGMRVANR